MKKRKIGSKILANQFSTNWFEPSINPGRPPRGGARRVPGAAASWVRATGALYRISSFFWPRAANRVTG